jgi:hypothetical protein
MYTQDLSYSEGQLLGLYEDLLTVPSSLSGDKPIKEMIVEENDSALMDSVHQRMVEAAYPFELPSRFIFSLTDIKFHDFNCRQKS